MINYQSSVFGSKKAKLLYVVKICVFLALVALTSKFLSFLLYDDTETISRYTMHEAYNQEIPIDTAVIGTSVCRDSTNPFKMDGALGNNVFNLATNSQTMRGTLYMLKEMNREGNIKKVYLSIFYGQVIDGVKERDEIVRVARVSDYIKNPVNRLAMIFQDTVPDDWIFMLCQARRDVGMDFEPKHITDLVKVKRGQEYKNYEYPQAAADHMGFKYMGKGYPSYWTDNAPLFCLEDSGTDLNKYQLTEDFKKTFIQVVDYCRSQGIELVVYNVPMSDYFCMQAVGLGDYIDRIGTFVREQGVEYYDFNLMKPGFFVADGPRYTDLVHMSGQGADEFSQVFADFFSGKISEEDLFFDSWEEKVEATKENVYGYAYGKDQNENGETVMRIHDVSAVDNPKHKYFTVIKSSGGDDYETVAVMQQNPEVVIPEGEQGTIIFYVFDDENQTDTTEFYEISY